MQGLGYPSHCPHTAPRVRVPVVAGVSELLLKTRPETNITSLQHYEETAVTRSLVCFLTLYQQYRLHIDAYKMTARCTGTNSFAVTCVSLMRTGYNANDEWVTAPLGELSHKRVGYYTISATSVKDF